jgi:hypothetical protein
MTSVFKYFFSTGCFLLCAAATIAQPENESQRGAYSSQQVRQARENAATNRHYESIKPSSSGTKSSSTTSTSNGTYSQWQPYRYSEKERQQYLENQRKERQLAVQKEKATQQALFTEQKNSFTMQLLNKGIEKKKENYNTIIWLAASAKLPDSFYYRIFGRSEQEFEQKIIAKDYYVGLHFPNPSRMMRPTSSSYYDNYMANQRAKTAVTKPAASNTEQNFKADTLQNKNSILNGLQLSPEPVKPGLNKANTYNKLLIKPVNDTAGKRNPIFKSLQLD